MQQVGVEVCMCVCVGGGGGGGGEWGERGGRVLLTFLLFLQVHSTFHWSSFISVITLIY